MEDSGRKAGRTRRPAAKTPAAAAGKSAAPAKAPAVRRAAVPMAPTTPKVPAGSAAPVDRDEMVRVAAYFRALRRGFAPGYEVADWLEAQAEVDQLIGTAAASKPRQMPAKKRPAD